MIVQFKAARRPPDYQMNIYAPYHINVGEAANTEVLANVFGASDRPTVEMRLGRKGPWIPMIRAARHEEKKSERW